MKDSIDFMRWLEDKWDSDYCPFALSLFVFIGMVSLRPLFSEAQISFSVWMVISLVFGCFAFIYWKYKHRVPKVPEGYIGLVVAIAPEQNDLRSDTVKDFVFSLKTILHNINHQHKSFYVLELSRYHSRKIVSEAEAHVYREKCNSKFLTFGSSRVRKFKNKDYHAVNLRGMVSHAPISLKNSSTLAGEMTAVLPLDFRVSCENDLVEFEAISQCFSESAKFIIATASMLSNDLELGLALLTELNNSKKSLETHKKNVQGVAKLLTLIPLRLAELYALLQEKSFVAWRQSRNDEFLSQAREYRQKIHQLFPDNLRVSLIEAIWKFVVKKDVAGALKEYNKCIPRYLPVPTLRYGRAFLYAYNGDMNMAEKEYEAAFLLDSSFEVAFEIEEFIAWILSMEPDKYQLHYCLAIINYRIKKDDVSTKQELGNFLAHENTKNKFQQTRDIARKLLIDIESPPKIAVII